VLLKLENYAVVGAYTLENSIPIKEAMIED
jgi:hypothetical protein